MALQMPNRMACKRSGFKSPQFHFAKPQVGFGVDCAKHEHDDDGWPASSTAWIKHCLLRGAAEVIAAVDQTARLNAAALAGAVKDHPGIEPGSPISTGIARPRCRA